MRDSGIAAVSEDLRSQFLSGLIPAHRKTILAAATLRRFRSNSVITNQDHPADHFYLLTKGLARFFFVTEEGRKLLFQWVGPGDVFGGRAVLSSPSTYLFSTETVTDCSVLVWDRRTIRSFVERHPRLLENALLTASDFLSWHLTSYIALACYTARRRVAEVLVTLGRTIGQKVAGGVELRITNEELANAANVTPFTASRLMSEWVRDRALLKRRGTVLLRSPDRLFLRMM
jgi:CRP-like cAMP-binding protein